MVSQGDQEKPPELDSGGLPFSFFTDEMGKAASDAERAAILGAYLAQRGGCKLWAILGWLLILGAALMACAEILHLLFPALPIFSG